jgi:chromosome segregation ATPase
MLDNEAYVKIYINRCDHMLLELMRKQLDLETKNVILDLQLKDFQKQLQDCEIRNTSLVDTLNQATTGLQLLTIERDQYKTESSEYSKKYADVSNMLIELKNKNEIITEELLNTADKLKIVESDLHTCKANYKQVCSLLDASKTTTEQTE